MVEWTGNKWAPEPGSLVFGSVQDGLGMQHILKERAYLYNRTKTIGVFGF